jgi:hypothetical protein
MNILFFNFKFYFYLTQTKGKIVQNVDDIFKVRALFLFTGLLVVLLLPASGFSQVTPTFTPTLVPSFSVSETVNSPSAQSGTGLILFSFPYVASNTTTSAVIASVVPPNTLLVALGPPSIVANAAGSAITWTIPASQSVTGTVWMLVKVPSTVPLGTVINSSGEYGLTTSPSSATNAVTAVVGPEMEIAASVSPSGASVGSVVNYNLIWKVTGEFLSVFDSYDNATIGAIGTASTGSEPWGYDGSPYDIEPSGTNATWTITSETNSDQYVLAANPGTQNGYLLRSSPGVQLAPQNNYSVAGAVLINTGSTSGSLALAMDSAGNNGYLVGLSTSPSPGILYVDRITSGSPTTLSTSSLAVSTDTFYAISAAVNPTTGGGSVTLLAKAWQAFQSVPSNYAITVVDPGVITSGEVGWEINPANTAAYTDLYLFLNNGLVNPVVTDTLPTGITFQNATPVATYTAPLVNFSVGAPVTVVGGSVTYSWTGVVNGCGTLNNQASINGSNLQGTTMPQVSSNVVTLQVACVSNNTPTPTPNGSLTPTPTPNQPLYLDSNVFNPTVQPLGMDVRVDTAGEVKILIFNMAGEEVEKLMDQQMTPGNYRFNWDGRNSAGVMAGNGIYFLVIEQPSGRMIKKVVVLK